MDPERRAVEELRRFARRAMANTLRGRDPDDDERGDSRDVEEAAEGGARLEERRVPLRGGGYASYRTEVRRDPAVSRTREDEVAGRAEREERADVANREELDEMEMRERAKGDQYDRFSPRGSAYRRARGDR